MHIGLGLSLTAQLRAWGDALTAAYAANGFSPQFVADFNGDACFVGGEASTLSGALEHSRADGTPIATYTDGTGTIQTVATAGAARTENHVWDGADWVKGYLHEGAATNLLVKSNDFTIGSDWSESNSITSSVGASVTSPDGTTNARTHESSTSLAGKLHQLFDVGITLTNGQPYTASIFFKSAGEVEWVSLDVYDGSDNRAWFNISTGAKGTNDSGVTSTITDVGGGWYRATATYTVGSTSGGFAIELSTADNTPVSTIPLGQGVVIYGAQFEQGSSATSYIATDGATVTRAADVMTLPIENVPYPVGGSPSVSIAVKGYVTGASSTFVDWTADASNGILMQSGASNFTFTQEDGGVVDSVTGGSYTSGLNVPFSIASRHGSTFINGAVDGTALTANTTPVAFPDLSATDLSLFPTGNFHVTKFRMWGDATGDIGDVGIAEASA